MSQPATARRRHDTVPIEVLTVEIEPAANDGEAYVVAPRDREHGWTSGSFEVVVFDAAPADFDIDLPRLRVAA